MKNQLFPTFQSSLDWALSFYKKICALRNDDTPMQELLTGVIIFALGVIVFILAVWLAHEIITSSSIPEMVHNR